MKVMIRVLLFVAPLILLAFLTGCAAAEPEVSVYVIAKWQPGEGCYPIGELTRCPNTWNEVQVSSADGGFEVTIGTEVIVSKEGEQVSFNRGFWEIPLVKLGDYECDMPYATHKNQILETEVFCHKVGDTD